MLKLAGLHVLIVEDEYFIARSIARIVEEAGGKNVGPARDLQAARDLLSGSEVDVAVLDIDIHGTDVYPLTSDLAARGVPFLFVTGYDVSGISPNFQNRPLVTKPFEDSAVLDAIVAATRPAA